MDTTSTIPHDLSSIIDMMQRKTELLQVQPTLEILLTLPLVMGPPLLLAFLGNLLASMLDPHYLTCPLFALLGGYVLLSFTWTPGRPS